MSNYQPRPGSWCARAIEHLRSLPPGTEVASAPLVEAIDASIAGFATAMKPAVDAGFVKARKGTEQGRPMYWSLGDGVPAIKPLDYTADEPLSAAPPVIKPTRDPLAVHLFGTKKQQPRAEDDAPASGDLFVALGMDGTLIISAGAERRVFTPAQRQLIARVAAA